MKMKTPRLADSLILSLLIIGGSLLISRALAQSADIQYPVAELGNCQDKAACQIYCDKPANTATCLDFAQKNNLMSEEEIRMAKKFLALGEKGPGDCRGQEQCEEYCNNSDHIEECITFAEENDLIPPAELAEARKARDAIRRGFKPPPCGGKNQCELYCDQPEHMEECLAFGKEAGFIQGQELADAEKMLAAIKRGVKPPPCRGKEACDQYCSEPENMESCMNFALEAGFMTEQEKTDSQKMLQALKKGIKPPQCRGKEECDVYCSEAEHFEECVNFAEAAGFMNADEAAMARKTKGQGAGGCRNKDECETFCQNPDNQETCFNFAKENGLIPEQDLRQMEEGKQKFQESLDQAPPEVLDCLNSNPGREMMEKLKNGSAFPPREIGEQMRSCYERMRPSDGQAGPENMNQSPTGPGGCKSPEECQSFCENNPQACQGFGPQPEEPTIPSEPGPQGPGTPPGGQPGGFAPPTEPEFQNPPEGFPPPANQLPPGEGQPAIPPAPPGGEVPPANENPTLPGSFLGPNSLLGSVINILLGQLRR